jgi:hypothetical protein
MGFKLINDGASIRIENGSKILFVTKDQVKTIDTIQNNIVRIDIGEGPLKNIFINYQDVETPVVASANELRDFINQMLLSDAYDGGDAKEVTQQSILTQMQTIATTLATIKDKETDFSQSDPSRTDESNPNMVYRGWHSGFGFVDVAEWAIERVRRIDDEEIREWAFGYKKQIYVWNDRANLLYQPWNHDQPVAAPLPDSNPPVVDPAQQVA